MIFEKYVPGQEKNAAFAAIADMVGGITDGRSYASMMARRISGAVAHECHDPFYVAHEDGKAASRLWMGWGRHKDAIGNWGNFYTVEAYRRRGTDGGNAAHRAHHDHHRFYRFFAHASVLQNQGMHSITKKRKFYTHQKEQAIFS